MTTATIDPKAKAAYLASAAILLALIIGVYYPIFCWLVDTWWHVSDYTYGFLVPVFSAFLLWDRREMLKPERLKGSYWGVAIILFAAAWSTYASYDFNHVLQSWTIVPLVGGLVVLIGGWHALQWAWPSVVFLIFMAPLPQTLATLLGHQLQAIGTSASVYVLQTLGLPAVADGNVIVLSKSPLEVADACSGIRMLMLFFAASVGMALYLRREPYIRILIGISAPPIAIISNVARITITAILSENVSPELANKVFHELAGWFMMPLALVLLWLETALLDRLIVTPERESPIALGTAVLGRPQRSEGPIPPAAGLPPNRIDG